MAIQADHEWLLNGLQRVYRREPWPEFPSTFQLLKNRNSRCLGSVAEIGCLGSVACRDIYPKLTGQAPSSDSIPGYEWPLGRDFEIFKVLNHTRQEGILGLHQLVLRHVVDVWGAAAAGQDDGCSSWF